MTEPWSERIPAAIAKAEELLGVSFFYGVPHGIIAGAMVPIFMRGEVALAKEFYEFQAATQMLVNAIDDEPPDVIWAAALCAFTEKVESL